jgi:hypothetical protein
MGVVMLVVAVVVLVRVVAGACVIMRGVVGARMIVCARRAGLRPRRRAPLTIYPPGVPILVVLLLPDGHPVFHFINDVSAGAERLIAVAGCGAYPYGHLSDRQLADAMYTRRMFDAEALDGFGDNPFALFHREWLERLILEVMDTHALIMVANQALEGCVSPARRVGELGSQ